MNIMTVSFILTPNILRGGLPPARLDFCHFTQSILLYLWIRQDQVLLLVVQPGTAPRSVYSKGSRVYAKLTFMLGNKVISAPPPPPHPADPAAPVPCGHCYAVISLRSLPCGHFPAVIALRSLTCGHCPAVLPCGHCPGNQCGE